MASSTAQDALFKPYDQFILFGDSITEMSSIQDTGFGLHGALQDAYRRRLDIINRGFGGYTTAHAIQVFPKFFPTPEQATVRFLALFFGANDACLPGTAQHVPLDQYKENLKRLIQHEATIAQKPRIMILTPTPINEYQLQGFDEGKGNAHPSRTASYTKTYADAVREVGASTGVVVADVWTAFVAAAGWKEGQPLPGSRDLPEIDAFKALFTDGLHLTADGYRLVYDVIMKAIQENWPDQDPEKLSFVHPSWMEAPK
ncbi:isoamyl acetate-hydrolyzing esterase [Aspergillus steynii IBT 23096]|uniref:Isoamyl acetate-hydrolyzing esterase n=1 Tax=Aspergillus steynii IBT 23096 TaxID=1392250 RepID=A0A2I2G7X2_9EURO|nr:isoamyl acetate-hydrolyzing esterase [Aspergillus steynii IBT 23096]PLB48982.1 isoamyl acetate-hydrolyzing esterase [Aspergillus steynii IBT 23096]